MGIFSSRLAGGRVAPTDTLFAKVKDDLTKAIDDSKAICDAAEHKYVDEGEVRKGDEKAHTTQIKTALKRLKTALAQAVADAESYERKLK